MLYSYIVLLVIVSTLCRVCMTNGIKSLDEGMLQSILGIFISHNCRNLFPVFRPYMRLFYC